MSKSKELEWNIKLLKQEKKTLLLNCKLSRLKLDLSQQVELFNKADAKVDELRKIINKELIGTKYISHCWCCGTNEFANDFDVNKICKCEFGTYSEFNDFFRTYPDFIRPEETAPSYSE